MPRQFCDQATTSHPDTSCGQAQFSDISGLCFASAPQVVLGFVSQVMLGVVVTLCLQMYICMSEAGFWALFIVLSLEVELDLINEVGGEPD